MPVVSSRRNMSTAKKLIGKQTGMYIEEQENAFMEYVASEEDGEGVHHPHNMSVTLNLLMNNEENTRTRMEFETRVYVNKNTATLGTLIKYVREGVAMGTDQRLFPPQDMDVMHYGRPTNDSCLLYTSDAADE